jgi:hypothetical protein
MDVTWWAWRSALAEEFGWVRQLVLALVASASSSPASSGHPCFPHAPLPACTHARMSGAASVGT